MTELSAESGEFVSTAPPEASALNTDFFLAHRRRDAGVIGAGLLLGWAANRPLATLGGVVMVGTLAFGAWAGASRLIDETMAGVDVTATTDVKHGKVTADFALDQTCIGGYKADVEVQSTVNADLPLLVGPFDPEQYTTLKTNITNIICPSSAVLLRTIDYDAPKGKPRVTLEPKTGAQPWTTYVFPTNAIDPGAYKSSANFGGTLSANNESNLKMLLEAIGLGDRIGATGSDMLRNYGMDTARMAAYDYVTKACANPAWTTLKPKVASILKEKVVREYNELNPRATITADEVKVELPDTISLDNQYSAEVQRWLSYNDAHPDSQLKLGFKQTSNPPACTPLSAAETQKGQTGATKP